MFTVCLLVKRDIKSPAKPIREGVIQIVFGGHRFRRNMIGLRNEGFHVINQSADQECKIRPVVLMIKGLSFVSQ